MMIFSFENFKVLSFKSSIGSNIIFLNVRAFKFFEKSVYYLQKCIRMLAFAFFVPHQELTLLFDTYVRKWLNR